MIDNWRHAKPVPSEFIQHRDGRIGMVMDIIDLPDGMGIQYEVTVQRYCDQPEAEWDVWYVSQGDYVIEG